jgi:hypothetical protein
MKTSGKLGIFVSILILAAMACALGGNGDNPDNPGGNSGGNSGGDTGGLFGSSANILFEDDFSNPESGWDRYSDAEGLTDYDNGAYKIAVYTDTLFYWANPYQTFGDVIVEVQGMKVSGGDDMQYGIICRHQDIENWYALVISGDGWAAIRKRYLGSDLDYIVDWTQTASVNTGNATNNLRAECVGSRLSLYVNGTLALEINDADLVSGDVGLIAGTFDQMDTEVLFDNFVVRQP